MNPARRPSTDAPRLASHASCLLACMVGLLGLSIAPSRAVVVYETDFDAMTADASLSGQDGWDDLYATGAQGVLYDDVEETNYAWFGFIAPDDPSGAYLYHPLDVDPVASGRPIVRFRVAFSAIRSSQDNGVDDVFSWSFYNRSGAPLGALDIDFGNLTIYRHDTTNDHDTGTTIFELDWYEFDVLIDFQRNTWTAYLYDYAAPAEDDPWTELFLDETFHDGSNTLDLGEIDLVWIANDPPGDNWLEFDNLSVRMLNRREAWYAVNFILEEQDIAAVKDNDDDGDGLSRDAEYAFGGDPYTHDVARIPFPAGTTTNGPASYLTLSFARRTGGALGITYEVEEAGTLSSAATWNTLSLATNELGTSPLLGRWEVAEVRGDRRLAGPGAVPRGHLRVRVVPDP